MKRQLNKSKNKAKPKKLVHKRDKHCPFFFEGEIEALKRIIDRQKAGLPIADQDIKVAKNLMGWGVLDPDFLLPQEARLTTR